MSYLPARITCVPLLALSLTTAAQGALQWSVSLTSSQALRLDLLDPAIGLETTLELSGQEIDLQQGATAWFGWMDDESSQYLEVQWTDQQGLGRLTRIELQVPGAESPHGTRIRYTLRRDNAWMQVPRPGAAGELGGVQLQPSGEAGIVFEAYQTEGNRPHPLVHAQGDVNMDGELGMHDLLIVLHSWAHTCPFAEDCGGDGDWDGDVDVHDLLLTLNGFTMGETEPAGSDAIITDEVVGHHHAWTWGATTQEGLDHMVPFVWAASWRPAEEVAAEALSRPEGHRVVFLFANLVNNMAIHPMDRCREGSLEEWTLTDYNSPWIDEGIQATKTAVTQYMQAFVDAGGLLDAVIIDNEDSMGAGMYLMAGEETLDAVMADPRFPSLADELGFWDLHSMEWGNEAFEAWNATLMPRFDAAINEAVFDVVRTFFPQARMTNYNSFRLDSDVQSFGIAGHVMQRQSDGCGTHDSLPFYGRISDALAETSPDGEHVIGGDAWAALRLGVHRLRAVQSSSAQPTMAWITAYHWTGDDFAGTPLAEDPMYDEMVLQLGMHGITTFLYWTQMNALNMEPDNPMNLQVDQIRVQALLMELDDMIDDGSAIPTLTQPSFGDDVVATSMPVNGSVVWRFSFSDAVDAVEVEFADGAIALIEREPGRSGAWFEHDANRSLVLDAMGAKPLMTEVSSAGI